uniref:rRNA biogenesis protein RRP36 n=1 Tax=Acrobeloides nanus TaxID=290746 RepID=A0A914DKU6_9BILA
MDLLSDIPTSSKLNDASSSEDDSDQDSDTMDLRQQISTMPLNKVKELRNKLGLKLFNKTYFGKDSQDEVSDAAVEGPKKFKRASQHKPREVSSKKQVSTFRSFVPTKKKFDPRFQPECGEFDDHAFRRDYGFLDGLKTNELQTLKKEYKNARKEADPDKVLKLKNAIRRLENQMKSKQESEMYRETKREIREENISRMNQGLKPIYVTRAELKKRFLAKKFQKIKDEGKIDSYLVRKGKKLAKKEK